jgi:hypothetical protein
LSDAVRLCVPGPTRDRVGNNFLLRQRGHGCRVALAIAPLNRHECINGCLVAKSKISQVIQWVLAEGETDDGAGDLVAVDRGARAERDDGHRAVDADLPARGTIKSRKRRRRHEHDDDGSRLRAQLEAKRGRDQIVIPGRPAGDQQRAVAIFAANSDPGQDAGRVVGKLRAPGVWRKNWSRLARTSALILAADASPLDAISAVNIGLAH